MAIVFETPLAILNMDARTLNIEDKNQETNAHLKLNKAFQRALATERKIAPRVCTPRSHPNSSPSTYQPTTNNPST